MTIQTVAATSSSLHQHPLCKLSTTAGAPVDRVECGAATIEAADIAALREFAKKALTSHGAEAAALLNVDQDDTAIAQTVACADKCRRLIDELSCAPFVSIDSPIIRAAVDVAIERSRGRLFGTSPKYRNVVL